jgi:hypothetical protein
MYYYHDKTRRQLHKSIIDIYTLINPNMYYDKIVKKNFIALFRK